MATCSFCRGKFKSEQGVKAHMKWCDQYEIKKSKKWAALGTKPQARTQLGITAAGHRQK